MNKSLPIGKEDFKKVIENNCYYIDKTNIIKEILQNGADVILFPRPRRFGKTLTISMLENYFDITKKEENKELFKGLSIDNEDDNIKKHFGAYPVIKIGLKEAKSDTFEKQYNKLKQIIATIYDEYDYVKEVLDDNNKKFYEDIQAKIADITSYELSIKMLSMYLERYYNKKVVILIDEYDAPIESGYLNDFYDENMEFIKSLFSAALKTNESLAFGVLTGILKISQESIFSGLNNLDVYSLLDKNYSEYFGFTKKEVEEILKYYNLGLTNDVKSWYNGYNFGETDIYNPWSILNYAKKQLLGSYWSNSGGINLIENIVKDANVSLKEKLKEIIEGKKVTGYVNENISYKSLISNDDTILSFLLNARIFNL